MIMQLTGRFLKVNRNKERMINLNAGKKENYHALLLFFSFSYFPIFLFLFFDI